MKKAVLFLCFLPLMALLSSCNNSSQEVYDEDEDSDSVAVEEVDYGDYVHFKYLFPKDLKIVEGNNSKCKLYKRPDVNSPYLYVSHDFTENYFWSDEYSDYAEYNFDNRIERIKFNSHTAALLIGQEQGFYKILYNEVEAYVPMTGASIAELIPIKAEDLNSRKTGAMFRSGVLSGLAIYSYTIECECDRCDYAEGLGMCDKDSGVVIYEFTDQQRGSYYNDGKVPFRSVKDLDNYISSTTEQEQVDYIDGISLGVEDNSFLVVYKSKNNGVNTFFVNVGEVIPYCTQKTWVSSIPTSTAKKQIISPVDSCVSLSGSIGSSDVKKFGFCFSEYELGRCSFTLPNGVAKSGLHLYLKSHTGKSLVIEAYEAFDGEPIEEIGVFDGIYSNGKYKGKFTTSQGVSVDFNLHQ